jgi:multidrug efflux pump subunit AcrA (membrane-fusion protein)
MPKTQYARKLWTLAVMTGMLSVAGCGSSAAPTQTSTSITSSSTTISVVHPQRKSLLRTIEQPGTADAYEETRLFARVPGYVRLKYDGNGRIHFDIGQKIRGPVFDSTGKETEAGEVMAELIVPELEEEVKLKKATNRQMEADVELARKSLMSAEAHIAAMEAAVIEATALRERWESELKRIAKLTKSGVIDEQHRDETVNQAKAAGARVQSTDAAVRKAKADRDKAAAEIQSTLARVDVAKSDALRAEAMLGYSKIRAPYDGIVTARKANTGDFMQPGAAKNDWLFEVARIDPIRIVIGVPEADAELVKEKSKVKLIVQAIPGRNPTGTVTRTSWSLNQGARTLRTEIDLANTDGSLRPGMYVYASIVGETAPALALPVTALAKHGDAMVCFLVEGGKAVRTVVQVGRSDGLFVHVLKLQKAGTPSVWEELTEDRWVAVLAAGLADGQPVASRER